MVVYELFLVDEKVNKQEIAILHDEQLTAKDNRQLVQGQLSCLKYINRNE